MPPARAHRSRRRPCARRGRLGEPRLRAGRPLGRLRTGLVVCGLTASSNQTMAVVCAGTRLGSEMRFGLVMAPPDRRWVSPKTVGRGAGPISVVQLKSQGVSRFAWLYLSSAESAPGRGRAKGRGRWRDEPGGWWGYCGRRLWARQCSGSSECSRNRMWSSTPAAATASQTR